MYYILPISLSKNSVLFYSTECIMGETETCVEKRGLYEKKTVVCGFVCLCLGGLNFLSGFRSGNFL